MNFTLNAHDDLSQKIRTLGIKSWLELTHYIQSLPYGRNTNRANLDLVIYEEKGSCSSKHAFLKKVADLHSKDVKLILGIYKMTSHNTTGIGSVLTHYDLEYIPEAHCYLKIGQDRFDFTTTDSSFDNIALDILEEKEIQAEEVIDFKVEYHQNYLRKWIPANNIPYSFEQLWEIREKCIANLSLHF